MSELRKQIIDQSAHTLWGAATGSVAVVGVALLGGVGMTIGTLMACGSCWFWTRRERLQFRNGAHVWWDPPLDNSVFWSAVAAGACLSYWLTR